MSNEKKDICNGLKDTPQEIYDSFNNLVFSDDTRVIHKMITKINIYNLVKHLNGDIFEFGVFKGASLALWLQLIKLYETNSLTSVVGFDFFDEINTLENMNGYNKKLMDEVIKRCQDKNDIKYDTILNKCNNILPNKTTLVKGNACETCIEFNNHNPGARIKLLYLDMDVDEPTYIVLINMWNKIVLNGIIVLDEYGFHKWDESNGVDRFLKTIKGKYKLTNTNIISPTLIIEKIDF